MKKTMIWNTVLIWLIATGFLAGTAGLGLLSGDKLASAIVTLAFGIFVFPIAGFIAGVQAANGHASFLLSIVIPLGLGITAFYFATDQLRSFNTDGLIVFTPLLAVLTGYGLMWLINYCKAVNPVLYYSSYLVAFVVGFIFLYLLGAYQSRMAYFSLPKALFYSQPANDVTDVYIRNDESILRTDEGNPFTGVITSYEERLNLNFFTKKESGIAYYIDGLNFGESGKVTPTGTYNSWHGSYTSTEFWYAGDPKHQNAKPVILLHKDYQYLIETEFPENKAVYYQETPSKDTSAFDPYPLPSIMVVFADDGHITRYHVRFHPNGVIEYIDRYFFGRSSLNEEVLSWHDREMFSFDKLGCRSYYETENVWSKNDFVETKFNALERIRNSISKDTSVVKNPDTMVYVPYPENWVSKDLMDNILAVYGIPLTTIYTYINDNDGYWQALQIADAKDLGELMTRSTMTINYCDDDGTIGDFQREAIQFRITSKDDKDKKLFLYYADNKILVQDGPYYLDVVAQKENESKDDIAFRKKIHKNVLAIIEKYTANSEPKNQN